jgi:hypothetical protein
MDEAAAACIRLRPVSRAGQSAVVQVSLEANSSEANQPALRSVFDSHEASIPKHDLLATALSDQLLVLAPELRLQGGSLPGGFGQIKPREFGHEVARFHGWDRGVSRCSPGDN